MKTYFMVLIIIFSSNCFAKNSDQVKLNKALNYYINGTSFNKPDMIKKAFYSEANLYLTRKDQDVWTVPSNEYVDWFSKKEYGSFTGRIGNIISSDINGNIASAKIEIIYPKRKLKYIDLLLLKKVEGEWKIISKTASSEKSNKNGERILFIVSNADKYGDSTLNTGNSYSELVNAYDTFIKGGYSVDFVSPEGGAIPLAYINTSQPLFKQYLYDNDFMSAIGNTMNPSQIKPENYRAVHYIGGGSAMFGVADNKKIQDIAMSIYEDYNGLISSVCHGTAGIVNLKTKDGQYLVAGKTISGYPEAYENTNKAYFKHFPFLIQKTIESRSGIFEYGPRNTAFIKVDGRVVTGQNYLSSAPIAEKMIEILGKL